MVKAKSFWLILASRSLSLANENNDMGCLVHFQWQVPFRVRESKTTCGEVTNANGSIACWTGDFPSAFLIAGLLALQFEFDPGEDGDTRSLRRVNDLPDPTNLEESPSSSFRQRRKGWMVMGKVVSCHE